jgi:hypothetical protein
MTLAATALCSSSLDMSGSRKWAAKAYLALASHHMRFYCQRCALGLTLRTSMIMTVVPMPLPRVRAAEMLGSGGLSPNPGSHETEAGGRTRGPRSGGSPRWWPFWTQHCIGCIAKVRRMNCFERQGTPPFLHVSSLAPVRVNIEGPPLVALSRMNCRDIVSI